MIFKYLSLQVSDRLRGQMICVIIFHPFDINDVRFSELLNHLVRILPIKRVLLLVQLILKTALNFAVRRVASWAWLLRFFRRAGNRVSFLARRSTVRLFVASRSTLTALVLLQTASTAKLILWPVRGVVENLVLPFQTFRSLFAESTQNPFTSFLRSHGSLPRLDLLLRDQLF